MTDCRTRPRDVSARSRSWSRHPLCCSRAASWATSTSRLRHPRCRRHDHLPSPTITFPSRRARSPSRRARRCGRRAPRADRGARADADSRAGTDPDDRARADVRAHPARADRSPRSRRPPPSPCRRPSPRRRSPRPRRHPDRDTDAHPDRHAVAEPDVRCGRRGWRRFSGLGAVGRGPRTRRPRRGGHLPRRPPSAEDARRPGPPEA